MCVLIDFVHIFCDKHMKQCLNFNSKTVNHAEDNKLYIYVNSIFFLLKNTTATEQDSTAHTTDSASVTNPKLDNPTTVERSCC